MSFTWLHAPFEHSAFESRRQDVAQHDQRFLVTARRHGIQAGVGVGNEHVFCLRSVNDMTQNPATSCAVRVHTSPAVLTFGTGRDTGNHDLFAHSKCRDSRTSFPDNTYTFVPENAARRQVALQDVQIRSTDFDFADLDDRVAVSMDLWNWTFFDEGRFTWPLIERALLVSAGLQLRRGLVPVCFRRAFRAASGLP